MRNTSLDEFLDADEAADAAAGDAAAGDERAEPEPGDDPAEPETEPERDTGSNASTDETNSDAADADTDPVEPAVSTFDWTPTGAECEDCGAVVERRWRDDAGLVCPACKTW